MTARLLPESEAQLRNAVEVLNLNSWPQNMAVEMGKLSWDYWVSDFWWQWVTLSMNSENGQRQKMTLYQFFKQSFAKILYIVLTEVRGWFCIADVDAERQQVLYAIF